MPNVILASLFHLPQEVYETRVRLCAGMGQTEVVTADQRRAMALGEMLHDILQALCRARVRGMPADGSCTPCRAWIISATHTRLREHLPGLFPGCQLHTWRPKGASKLSGRIQKALEVIDQLDHEGFGDEIAYAELADDTRIARGDFRKQVATDPRFQQEIADRGYVEAMIPRETSKGPRMAKGIIGEVVFPTDPGSSFVAADLD